MNIFSYLLIINIAAFVAYGLDKQKAEKAHWRIPEAALIMLAFAGGALGALVGMGVFRHKTKYWKFRILVPFALILWFVGLGYWTCYSLFGYNLIDFISRT